jgi:hypothetical protein
MLRQGEEIIMRDRSSHLTNMVVIAAAGAVVTSMSITPTSAQAPATPVTTPLALKTPWGEPDLQGIWKDEFDTPLQRPAKYAAQDFSPKSSEPNWTKSGQRLWNGGGRGATLTSRGGCY